ncbi:MAG: hypothetical protein OSB67_06560 [Alphaproteobacteria bacterium]|nr:hypothetical protein [Alphaproteobacteria bacterium]
MMRLLSSFLVIGLAALHMSQNLSAQTLGFSQGGDGPIHIEADEGIEWQRSKQLYLARGNAKASQGGVVVEGDELIAYYRSNAAGGNEIYRIDANGNVRIISENEVAQSDNAVYDIDGGVLFLTGDAIRLDTPEDTIVARDSLEYYEQRQMAIARGDAVAIRKNRRLRADTLTAHFGEGGRRASMERIEALGNVLVSTPTDIIRAEKGDYNPDLGLATVTGNVKITRGDIQLNGERAEVNLKSGRSRLLSSRSGEKVRGLFLPKSSRENGTGPTTNTGATAKP